MKIEFWIDVIVFMKFKVVLYNMKYVLYGFNCEIEWYEYYKWK